MSALAAVFPLVYGGKTPAIKVWQHTKPGDYKPDGNYGINLAATVLIIDCDPRNYPDGRDMLGEIWQHIGVPTRTVKTPRGGYHFYFTKPADKVFKKKQANWPGIDFLSHGCYVCGPGTKTVYDPIAETVDGFYELLRGDPIAVLPDSLLNSLEERSEAQTEGFADASLQYLSVFERDCETTAPAVEGSYGDQTTYNLACRGRDYGLPKESAYAAMRDYFNPRCQPPWEEIELWNKVKHAYQYAKNSVGSATAEAKFKPEMVAAQPAAPTNVVSIDNYQDEKVTAGLKPMTLDMDSKMNVLPTLSNVIYFLREHEAWKGRVRYNEFSCALEFSRRPTWRTKQLNVGLEVEKRDFSNMRGWFSTVAKIDIPKDKLVAGMETAAHAYHPVREYLDSLTWDGVRRLDTILIDTAEAEDSLYTREVGRCLLLSAVQRIYEPGCKHDHVPVLEGPQGIGKSQWVSILGGEWYSASELVRGDKDSYQNLRGRWFVELPEINATFSKADFNWLKGVITNPTDVYRSSYGETSRGVPRESVFIGSINPGCNQDYLKDEENRRYWPIKTHRFELGLLKRNRDQYFAEAVYRYRQGEKNYMTDPRAIAEARIEQEARQEKDPWVSLLSTWVSGKPNFSPNELYAAFNFNAKEIGQVQTRRLRGALKVLGFTYRPEFSSGGQWVKEKLTWGDVL